MKTAAVGLAAGAGLPRGLSFAETGDARLGLEVVEVNGKLGVVTTLPDGRLMTWWTEGKRGEDWHKREIIENPDIPQKAFATCACGPRRTRRRPRGSC